MRQEARKLWKARCSIRAYWNLSQLRGKRHALRHSSIVFKENILSMTQGQIDQTNHQKWRVILDSGRYQGQ